MQHALMLADRAEALGEIPVGALLVDDEGNILGEGWNLSIIENEYNYKKHNGLDHNHCVDVY